MVPMPGSTWLCGGLDVQDLLLNVTIRYRAAATSWERQAATLSKLSLLSARKP